jgi:hypothetical protein
MGRQLLLLPRVGLGGSWLLLLLVVVLLLQLLQGMGLHDAVLDMVMLLLLLLNMGLHAAEGKLLCQLWSLPHSTPGKTAQAVRKQVR